jgi:hypothetical protein
MLDHEVEQAVPDPLLVHEGHDDVVRTDSTVYDGDDQAEDELA